MNTTNNKIFIGVAWPYVNGDLHPGHFAGCYLPSDIFVRFARLKGYDCVMVSGTDCYGTPITVEADKRGITPKELVEIYNPRTKALIQKWGISFDLFTETITDNHKQVTQDFFIELVNNGYIVKQTTKQYYSQVDNKFLPDRYVEGECPYCHTKNQRADQCDICGRSLLVGELIGPISKLTGAPVTLKDTEHYFLDLNKLSPELSEYLKKAGKNWRNWIIKEAESWLAEGLEPRSITRDLDWGIEIPEDKIPVAWRIENSSSKRFYVWFDACIGYFSATKEWAKKVNRNWKDFWLDHTTKHYYFVGKDNLFFHTLWWQALLLGQEKDYKLSDITSVNQFLNLEGQKFSKSRGIYIDSNKLIEAFGLDAVRFYLASIMPENKDANWKWDDFRNTINSELIGNIGNFINRTLVFYKNKLLSSGITLENIELDIEVETETKKVFEEVSDYLTNCEFVNALNTILRYSKFGNQYFDQKKPWVSVKEDIEACKQTIFSCLQIVYALNSLLKPYIPESTVKLSQLLGIKELNPEIGINKYNFDKLDISKIKLNEEIMPLFKKIEEEDIINFLQN